MVVLADLPECVARRADLALIPVVADLTFGDHLEVPDVAFVVDPDGRARDPRIQMVEVGTYLF